MITVTSKTSFNQNKLPTFHPGKCSVNLWAWNFKIFNQLNCNRSLLSVKFYISKDTRNAIFNEVRLGWKRIKRSNRTQQKYPETKRNTRLHTSQQNVPVVNAYLKQCVRTRAGAVFCFFILRFSLCSLAWFHSCFLPHEYSMFFVLNMKRKPHISSMATKNNL